MTSAIGPEFSFVVQLSEVGNNWEGNCHKLEANTDQCSALAVRFGCIEIQNFEVNAMIRPHQRDGLFCVSGAVSARVVQYCVISLGLVSSEIEQEFRLVLIPETQEEATQAEFEEDEFETYTGNSVDLGEIGAIELALALDPFPRAPGISVTDLGPGGYEVSDEGRVGRNRPFEVLAALKRKG